MDRPAALRLPTGPETDTVDPYVLGIDEAGRGSVVGPLVVGGFLIPETCVPQLVPLGVRDSKELTPARREEIYESLGKLGRRLTVVLDPRRIDTYVRRGRLNELEARAFGRLVRASGAARAYVDACDTDERRFGGRVAHWAGVSPERIDARHKADRDLPIVGAASIVAKVVRDRRIRRLARSLGAPIGSGYPADASTRAFVRSALLDPKTPTPWLRHSWATTQTLKPRPSPRTLESF